LSADGGPLYQNGYFKGPGGGGRIALSYQSSSFGGIIEAKGGCGSYDGWSKVCAGDGTVHIVDKSIVPTPPDPAPIIIPPVVPPVTPPDTTSETTIPSITNYTFNGVAGDITINPLVNALTFVLAASENVNWMSVEIEKQDSATKVYKLFKAGIGCVSGTNTCTKVWDGILSSGELLTSENGIYRIKVHIKDAAGNEYNDYLSPYTITVNTQN